MNIIQDRHAEKIVIDQSNYVTPKTGQEQIEQAHNDTIEEKIRKKRVKVLKVKSVKRLPQEIIQYVDAYT